jgi:hypothetical protein
MCCPNREGMKYEVGHIILHNTNERLSVRTLDPVVDLLSKTLL